MKERTPMMDEMPSGGTILVIAVAIAGVFLGSYLTRKDDNKPFFNVQLNTGEYWACYPRPDQNLVPLCIPRSTKPRG